MGLSQEIGMFAIAFHRPAGIEYVKSPVLLFHGEQDSITPPSTVLKLVQK